MPYVHGDNNIDEFVSELTNMEEVISGHCYCHVVLAGDFNVDSCRDWSHTPVLKYVSVRIVVLFPLIVMLRPTSTIPIHSTRHIFHVWIISYFLVRYFMNPL